MDYVKIELPLTEVDENYSDYITYIALGKARKLGFYNGANLFTQAFKCYDEALPKEYLELQSAKKTSAAFLKTFNIKYKEDMLYIIRHPELYPDNIVETLDTHRRMLIFDGESKDPAEIAAIKFLEGIQRRERAGIIDKIVTQYFIKSGNNFYFEQKAAKLYYYMCEHAEFTDGNVQDSIKELIGMIWELGSEIAKKQ